MSLDDLIQAEAVPSVPPENKARGTEKMQANQEDAPGAPGAPDITRDTGTGSTLAALLASACEGLGLEPAELRALLTDEDVADLSADEQAGHVLRAFAAAVADRHTRESGRVPASHTERAYCRRCGPIWAPFSGTYLGCPWCHVRANGVAIPRPPTREGEP